MNDATKTDAAVGPDQAGLAGTKLALYDAGWGTYLPRLERLAAAGASPCELVGAIDARWSLYRGFIDETIRRQIPHLDPRPFGLRPEPYRLAVAAGRYVAVTSPQDRRALFDILVDCLDPEVDCVVEFGSGLGANLSRLRSRCPGRSPTYIACEPSANGRRITRMLFANDPDVRLQVRPFDFNGSSLDFLDGFSKVVAFTCHAVEQMTVLGEAFYRRLLDSPAVVCLHWEPFGWQRHTQLAAEVQALQQDAASWRRHHNRFIYRISDDALSTNAANWSSFCHYNRDLLRLAAGAADRGEIRITALGYDLEGDNPFNPSSLIAWARRR